MSMKLSCSLITDQNSTDLICSADSGREVHTRVSLKQCEDHIFGPERESHVLQSYVSASKCETHILHALKHETRVLPVPKRGSRVSNSKCETLVLKQTQPTLEVRISTKKHEALIQNGMSLRYEKPKSPHPHGFEANSPDVPATDLRDYLIRKRNVPATDLRDYLIRKRSVH